MLTRDYSKGKGKRRMPGWSRVVAGAFGLLFFGTGVAALLVYRPLTLEVGIAASGSTVLGLTLLGSACSGEWPSWLTL